MKKIVLQLFLIVGLTAFYGCGEEDPSTGSFGSGTAVVPPTVTKPVESNPDEVIPSTVIDPVTDPVTDIINVVSRTAKSTEQKGVFIDTLVKGLTVVQYNESGEVLETDDSEAKTTASDGTFVVLDGSVEIEFKIGDNLSVGRAKANLFSTADGKDAAETVVTIVDLFNTESIYDSRVRFVARVLLTLDTDSNIEGIQLPEVLPAGFDDLSNIDYSLQGSAAENQLKELFGEVTPISDVEAEDHLKNSVIELEKLTTITEAGTDVCPSGGLIKEYKVDFNKDRVYETYSTVHCDKTSNTEQTKTYRLSPDKASSDYDENCPNGGIRIHHKQYEVNERAQVARLIADYNSYKCEAAYYMVLRKEAQPFDQYDGNDDGKYDDEQADCNTGGIKYLTQHYKSGNVPVGNAREQLAHCNNDGIKDSTLTYTYLTLSDGNKYCPNGGIQESYYEVENGETDVTDKNPLKMVYICNSQDDGFTFGEHTVEIIDMESKDENIESICPYGGLEFKHTADYDNDSNTEPTKFSEYECVQYSPEDAVKIRITVAGLGEDLNGDDVIEWFQSTGLGDCPYGGNIFNYKTYVGGTVSDDQTEVIDGVFHSEFNETRCLEGDEIVIEEINATETDEVESYRPIIFGIGKNTFGVGGRGTCEYQGGKIITTKVLYNGYVNWTKTSTICNSEDDMDFSSEKKIISEYMVDKTTKCVDWTISHYRQLLSDEEPNPNEKVLNYEQNETICENVGEEEPAIVEETLKTSVNSAKSVASNISLYCDSERTNGSVEIIGVGSTISMINYDEDLVSDLGLTTSIDGYSKILYFHGTTSSENWQKLFRTVKLISGKTGKYKVILTVGNSDAQKIHLGTVSGSETIDGNLEEWGEISENGNIATKTESLLSGKTSVITTTGYKNGEQKSLTFKNIATTTSKLANHASIGIGISEGQIYGKSSNVDENEKIIINFTQPVTNIQVALTGIGGHFIEYDFSIESTNFTTSREYSIYNKQLTAYNNYNAYLFAKTQQDLAIASKKDAETIMKSAKTISESAKTIYDSAVESYNSAETTYNNTVEGSDEQATALTAKNSAKTILDSADSDYSTKLANFNSANDLFSSAETDLTNKTADLENATKNANDSNTEYESIKTNYDSISEQYLQAISSMSDSDSAEEMSSIFNKASTDYLALPVMVESEYPKNTPVVVALPLLDSYYAIYKKNLKNGQLANARIVWSTYYEDTLIETDNLYRDSSDIDGDGREATKRIDTTVPTTRIVFEITSENGKGSNYALKYLNAEYLNIGSCDTEIFSKTYNIEVVTSIDVIVPDRQFTYTNALLYADAKGLTILSEEEYETITEISTKLHGNEYWTTSVESTDYTDSDGEVSQIIEHIVIRVADDGSLSSEVQPAKNYKFVAFRKTGSAKTPIDFKVVKTGSAFIQSGLIEAQATCNAMRKRVPTVDEMIATYFTNYGTNDIPLREYWSISPAPSVDFINDDSLSGIVYDDGNVESTDTGTGAEDISLSENSNENFAQMIRISGGNEDYHIETRMDRSFYKSIICIGDNSGSVPTVTNIVGRVIDEQGLSVEGATVKFGSNLKFVTNGQGGFSIGSIPAGIYTVEFSKDGYVSKSKVVRLFTDNVSVETAIISGKVNYMGWAKPNSGTVLLTYENGETEVATVNPTDGRYNIMINTDQTVISVKHIVSGAEITAFDTQHNRFWNGNDAGEILLQKNVPIIYSNLNNGCVDNEDISEEAFDKGYCNVLNVEYIAKIEFADNEEQIPYWTYAVYNRGSKTQDGDTEIKSFTIGLTDNTLDYLPTPVTDQTGKYRAIHSYDEGTQGLEVTYGDTEGTADNVVFAMNECSEGQLIYNDGIQALLTISFENGEALSTYIPVPICQASETHVTGKVTGFEDEGVENARVFINYLNSGITEDVYTTTNSDGIYHMMVQRGKALTINAVYTEEIDDIEVDRKFGTNNIFTYERLLNQNIEIPGDKDTVISDLVLNPAIRHLVCTDEVVENVGKPSLNGVTALFTNGNKRFGIVTNETGIDPAVGCSSLYLPFGKYSVTASKQGYSPTQETVTINLDTQSSNFTLVKNEEISYVVTKDFYESTVGSCYIGSSYIVKLEYVTSKNTSYEFNYDVQRITGNEMLKEFTLDVDTSCIQDITQSGEKAEDGKSITWTLNGGNFEFNTIESDNYIIEIQKVNAHFITYDGFVLDTQIEAPVCVPVNTGITQVIKTFKITDSSNNPIANAEIEANSYHEVMASVEKDYYFGENGIPFGTATTDSNGEATISINRSSDEGVIYRVTAEGFDTNIETGDRYNSSVEAISLETSVVENGSEESI